MTDPASQRFLDEVGLESSTWAFPPATSADRFGLVAVGGDLAPQSLITAYCGGLFPMPVGRRRRLGWWSPDPRGILAIDSLVISRSLRRSLRRYEIRIDTAFTETMTNCGDPRRNGAWITSEFVRAYSELHRLGVAHSVETWLDDELVGGLYGVSLGGLFAGESMFHRQPDASKVALVALVGLMAPVEHALLDVQWATPHLLSLGVTECPRWRYLELLRLALAVDGPEFSPGPADQSS